MGDLAPAELHQLSTPKSFRFQEWGQVLNLKIPEFLNPEVIKSLESLQSKTLDAHHVHPLDCDGEMVLRPSPDTRASQSGKR